MGNQIQPKQEKVQFVRRIKAYGIYTGWVSEKKEDMIRIEGRSIYITDDKKEIAFLRTDPEIEEHKDGEVVKKGVVKIPLNDGAQSD